MTVWHRSPEQPVGEALESADPVKRETAPVELPPWYRSPDELVGVALESADPAEQEKAAVELAALGRPAMKHLQRVLAESQSDRVRAAVARGLASEPDYDSMPVLLDALADPSPVVRDRAGAAVQQLLGAEFQFAADAPPEERERDIAAIRKEWERLRDSPAFESRKWHRSPAELVQIALESADPSKRQKAAAELTELGRPALKHLRRLVTESQSDGVRAVAIQGLAFQRDYECMPALLDAMEDPSLVVRGRAGAAVERLVGLDFNFDADAPLEKRERLIAAMRREWKNLRDSPGFKVRRKEMQSQR